MPGYSYGIPAAACITGSQLAKIEGTACSVCYAKRGRVHFPSVQRAQRLAVTLFTAIIHGPMCMCARNMSTSAIAMNAAPAGIVPFLLYRIRFTKPVSNSTDHFSNSKGDYVYV
jgi:hypothetical protein